MGFIDELKSYLLRVRHFAGNEKKPEQLMLEPAWVRAEVIQMFEQLESGSGLKRPGSGSKRRSGDSARSSETFKDKFEDWMEDDVAVRFADKLAMLLQESFLRGASREEVERYVRQGMAMRLGLDVQGLSRARTLELERLSELAWDAVPHWVHQGDDWVSVADYALEIRAVRRAGREMVLTPIGGVFVSLSGRDAVQWLLNVEVAQSTGPFDDWRLSRETVNVLLSEPKNVAPLWFWAEVEFPHSWSTLRRLQAMGVLRIVDEVDGELTEGYELLASGMQVLESLVSPNGTPFSVLASTLSQDAAIAALDVSAGKALPDISLSTSAQATARQARLVVHEIRNALIPAQFALNSLYESLVGSVVEAEVARFRPRIDPGIARVLKFVNDLLRTSELATRPPELFNIVRAVQDAQVSLTTSLDIQFASPSELPPVLGYRERFVLAIVNLLRNAEQAGARHVTVDLTLEDGGQDILLTVDDDGPGVPEEYRERIFQRGVSLRPGGSGEGLALVKEVVEVELRGKIACVEKPGGGARFRMRVPLAERSAR